MCAAHLDHKSLDMKSEDYWQLKYIKASIDKKSFEKSIPCSMCLQPSYNRKNHSVTAFKFCNFTLWMLLASDARGRCPVCPPPSARHWFVLRFAPKWRKHSLIYLHLKRHSKVFLSTNFKAYAYPLTPDPAKILAQGFSPTLSNITCQPIQLESCGQPQEIPLN